MKKTLAALLAILLCLLGTGAVLAQDVTDEGDDVAGTDFALWVDEDDLNQSSFTVTIPDTVELALSGTNVTIRASDIGELDGQKISVQFGGTNRDENRLELENTEGDLLYYTLQSSSGRTLVTADGGDDQIGTELVSFTQSGSKSYRVAIRTGVSDPDPVANTEYHGTVTYNIALID